MTKLKIKSATPCGYHVLVELISIVNHNDDGEATSEGGILLCPPDSQAVNFEQDGISVGKVVKVGKFAHKNLSCGANGHKDWGYDIGDMISFQKHMGKKVSDDPKDMQRLLVDHEVMMKVEIGE